MFMYQDLQQSPPHCEDSLLVEPAGPQFMQPLWKRRNHRTYDPLSTRIPSETTVQIRHLSPIVGSTRSTLRLALSTLFVARSLIGLTMVPSTLVSTKTNITKPYNINRISVGTMSIWVTLLPNGWWYRFPPDQHQTLLKLTICGYP